MSNINEFESENNYGNGGFAPEADDNDKTTENIIEESANNAEDTENVESIDNIADDGDTATEYPVQNERRDTTDSNDFRTPESLSSSHPTENIQSGDAQMHRPATPVNGTGYARPQSEAENTGYQALPMYNTYNMNAGGVRRDGAGSSNGVPYNNGGVQHPGMPVGTRPYNGAPRPVGESAGIRYNADKTSADGNYTWQYCRNGQPMPPEPPKKNEPKVLKTVAISLASLLSVGIIGCGVFLWHNHFEKNVQTNNSNPDGNGGIFGESYDSSDNNNLNEGINIPFIAPNTGDQSEAQTVIITPSEDGTLTKQMIAVKCKPSSVGIEVSATTHSYFGSYKSSGVGSGFVLSADGYIATNNHVIEGADEITVMLDNGTKHAARVIGADSVTDLAVIKIDAEGLVPMEIGDSDLMQVGDSVIAIGTPAGIEFAGTVTDGIVSAVNRPVEVQGSNGYAKTMTLMQTNAAINPGNSGGPLINNKGQVIGINTLKLTEEYEGIGFSIPINSAITIFNQLIKDGKVTDYEQSFVTGTGAIGITNYFEVTEEESKYYGIPVGVMVIQLKPGSASQAAGLKRGDIITGFNGQKVTTVEEINKLKASFKAGDEVTLTVYRDPTEIIDITFKLDVMG